MKLPNIVFTGALQLSKLNCFFSLFLLGPFYRIYFWNKQKTVEIKFVKTFSTQEADVEEKEKEEKEEKEPSTPASLASVIIPLSFAKDKPKPYENNIKGFTIKTFVCNLKAPWSGLRN